jgi:S-adenosylmethionine synthetase
MHSQKGYNIYSKETFEEKQQRIKKIAENVLSAQMYNMIAFTVSESLIREVVNDCCEYYDVENEFRKEMEGIIKEYVANKQRTQHV